ncbi:MAG: hypothetical protein VX372_02160 [Verrucomicrobiota bacterium]|nr:hypothetical protein [Verrucomicrobiota bacterium]MEE2988352.1 hypothetical protein [Verrucomicrobiota bacterium]
MKLLLPILLLGASCAHAQDYSSTTITEPKSVENDGGLEAVITAQEAVPVAPRPVVSARKQLTDWARSKGMSKFYWDPEKSRILQLVEAGANVDASESVDFTAIRESLYIEAELRAKASIIEGFLTTASAENLLEIPGNPIAKQLEAKQKELKQKQKVAQGHLDKARSEAQLLMAGVDQALSDQIAGAGYSDRAKALLDAAIKKLDENYSTDQISEDKARRIEDLRLRLSKANETEQSALKLKLEIDKEVAELQDTLKKKQSSTVEITSEMPLFGAVTIAQSESYDDLRGGYTVAILVAWSPKLELEARSILLGNTELKPRPNKKSFDQWLMDLDLSVMVGSRRYLSKDGSTNFVGISAVEYDPDDFSSISEVTMEAELWAKSHAILSLAGDVSSYKKAERLRQTVRGADGKAKEKILKDMSVELRNSVDNMQVRGLQIVHTEEVVHPASGRNMLVAVASVNSALATQSSELMKDTYATLTEINENQSYLKGEVEGMQAVAASKKNDPTARRAGQLDGASAVSSEYVSRNTQTAATVKNAGSPSNQVRNSPSQSGTIQSGNFLGGVDDIDDDF